EYSENCASDSLTIGNNVYSTMRRGRASNSFCGGLDRYNETARRIVFPVGKVFIRFIADKQNSGKGFKIAVSEILEECSDSVIAIDESTPNRTIHTPLWPAYVPSSAACSWTLRAPSAHRLSLTFDPDHFDLYADLGENKTCGEEDYVEVRDGASF
ncbi:hypothetical protein PFISCL1PPCAC_1797, partial [Pristionchus fissidentatus]